MRTHESTSRGSRSYALRPARSKALLSSRPDTCSCPWPARSASRPRAALCVYFRGHHALSVTAQTLTGYITGCPHRTGLSLEGAAARDHRAKANASSREADLADLLSGTPSTYQLASCFRESYALDDITSLDDISEHHRGTPFGSDLRPRVRANISNLSRLEANEDGSERRERVGVPSRSAEVVLAFQFSASRARREQETRGDTRLT